MYYGPSYNHIFFLATIIQFLIKREQMLNTIMICAECIFKSRLYHYSYMWHCHLFGFHGYLPRPGSHLVSPAGGAPLAADAGSSRLVAKVPSWRPPGGRGWNYDCRGAVTGGRWSEGKMFDFYFKWSLLHVRICWKSWTLNYQGTDTIYRYPWS